MFKKLIEFFTRVHCETVSRFSDASKNRKILGERADRRVSETMNISDKKPEHNRRKTDRIESSRSSLNRDDSTTTSSYSYRTDSSSCSSDSGSCGGGCD